MFKRCCRSPRYHIRLTTVHLCTSPRKKRDRWRVRYAASRLQRAPSAMTRLLTLAGMLAGPVSGCLAGARAGPRRCGGRLAVHCDRAAGRAQLPQLCRVLRGAGPGRHRVNHESAVRCRHQPDDLAADSAPRGGRAGPGRLPRVPASARLPAQTFLPTTRPPPALRRSTRPRAVSSRPCLCACATAACVCRYWTPRPPTACAAPTCCPSWGATRRQA